MTVTDDDFVMATNNSSIVSKRSVELLNNPLLRDTLGGEQQHVSLPHVLMDKQSYAAIGCDLRDLTSLNTAVKSILRDMEDPVVLCLAEVSMAYMPAQEADALIRWASTLASVLARRPSSPIRKNDATALYQIKVSIEIDRQLSVARLSMSSLWSTWLE
ncbi:MAG: hypothetical protein Q9160_001619 [Pyrenula sp. 1 TL-2023]